jgi:hypothetical protein
VTRRSGWWAILSLVLALPAFAQGRGNEKAAAPAEVPVKVEVVLASNQGTAVDPPELAKVKEKFQASGIVFTSYRRLSTQKVALKKGAGHALTLPSGKKAQLTLNEVKGSAAELKLEIAGPRPVTTVIQLGREGAIYQDAGTHQGGRLILVLSPP